MSLAADFTKIFEQYDQLNTSYVAEENLAVANDDFPTYANWVEKRNLNDAIHFLFMFARFENFVREKSSELINSKVMAANYADRASWIILKEDDRKNKLHLMRRVQLFIDKGDARFGKITEYYDTRNQLAHGGNYHTPTQIDTAKQELLTFSALFIVP